METPDQGAANEHAAIAVATKRRLSRPAVILSGMTASDEVHRRPEWVRFTLTGELICTLFRLHDLCASARIARCAVRYAPNAIAPDRDGDDTPWRTDDDFLFVDADQFWLSARDHYTDAVYESYHFWFRNFFHEVAGGRRAFSVDDDDDELKRAVARDLARLKRNRRAA